MSLQKKDKEIWDQAYEEGDLTDEEYRKEVGEDPPVLSKKKEPSEEEPSDKKEEESEEESKKKPSKKEEESNEEKKTEEEKPEKHKEKEKKETQEEEEEFTRTPMIPLSKHKKLKEKYRELKKDVASGKKTKEEAKEEINKELDDYAKDNKLDGKQLGRLVGIIKKQIVPEKKVDDKETKEAELENRLAKEEIGYNKDFDKSVLPILAKKYPKMTAIQEKKVRNMFQKLAFTKELAKTPLRLIYYGNIKKIKSILIVSKKKSAEGSRGTGADVGKDKNIGKLPLDREPTEEEFDNASDKEFDAWNEKMEKKSKRLNLTGMDGKEIN